MASGRAEDMPEGDRGGCGLWLSATVCWVATLVGGAELAGRLSAQRSRHLPKINSGLYNFWKPYATSIGGHCQVHAITLR